MNKFIFLFLFLILAFNSFSQNNKNIYTTKVILSNNGKAINNNDSISSPGPIVLTISNASDAYQITEAEYSMTLKRGKAIVKSMIGKGKEISLVELAAFAQPKDLLIIEIKKIKVSKPEVFMKPSNSLFKIYLK